LTQKEFTKGPIDGVVINKLTKHLDSRGSLCETYRADELPAGLTPAMSYISYTEPGIARGPHEHRDQTDIFAMPGPGNFLLKLWDNRPQSPTYGSYMQIYAGRDNPLTVIVPPGVVHGYLNTSKTESAMVINYPNRLFMGPGRKDQTDEIRHEEDPSSPFKLA
jgi:dTDP-4-dehydrorhamnose 3,5-epimerase